MQTKIKNPYDHKPEEVSPASREIIEAMQNAFDKGVKANSPRKFSEDMPEEGQEVLLFGIDRGILTKIFLEQSLSEGKYYGYTHWLPYPTL